MKNTDPLQREIRRARKGIVTESPSKVYWGIMPLSAAPHTDSFGNIISEWTDENFYRIILAYAVIVNYINGGIRFTPERGPWLILNGERGQLPMMTTIALQQGVPAAQIMLTDCGERPNGNTKTQFSCLREDPRLLGERKEILVITSWYHVPRVARTAPMHGPSNITWAYKSIPGQPSHLRWNSNWEECIIQEEARKIREYTEKDELAKRPDRYLVNRYAH